MGLSVQYNWLLFMIDTPKPFEVCRRGRQVICRGRGRELGLRPVRNLLGTKVPRYMYIRTYLPASPVHLSQTTAAVANDTTITT